MVLGVGKGDCTCSTHEMCVLVEPLYKDTPDLSKHL